MVLGIAEESEGFTGYGAGPTGLLGPMKNYSAPDGSTVESSGTVSRLSWVKTVGNEKFYFRLSSFSSSDILHLIHPDSQ